MPEPDNTYDKDAVAVVAPEPGTWRIDKGQHIAWVKNDHLNSLRPSIIGLLEATGEPVGFRGLIKLDSFVDGQDYDSEPDGEWLSDNDSDDILTLQECKKYRYSFTGVRADIGPWRPVRDAVLEFVRPRTRGRILPMVSRWGSWKLDKDHPTRLRLTELEQVDVDFLAAPDRLQVRFADEVLCDLDIDPDGYFARTHAQVVEFGGRARGRILPWSNGITVMIEDPDPVELVPAPRRWQSATT